MSFDYVVPNLGQLVDEVKVLRWLKQEGDKLEKGDALVEVDADKANMELEVLSPCTLVKIVAEEGKWIPVGGLLAVLE
jgi:pyruvate/2-oxoglutarate dehydrogenase complex dihydrolipoamide acyltransferase (E2) component